ncbi:MULTISPECIES: hypothetical protein [unclassified Sphingomonas]|uniref:hypothetical protein n=1 Tax=unclassified Sphingomonas TaxID=196159 RepID=UPI000A6258CD|nr:MULTISPECIES: hypothetical protein [unclassified Sphingomonas]MBD8549739.1 hypothetical protein [Sphingomonas sp. CFBP 8764]
MIDRVFTTFEKTSDLGKGQTTKPVAHRLNERLFAAIAARKRPFRFPPQSVIHCALPVSQLLPIVHLDLFWLPATKFSDLNGSKWPIHVGHAVTACSAAGR